jgi:hypothetical protein
MLLESLPREKLQTLHPLALERLVSCGGRWYYENALTGKKRRFPKADDWTEADNEAVAAEMKAVQEKWYRPKRVTQLTLVMAKLKCSCGNPMMFQKYFLDPQREANASRKSDRVYVYFCQSCKIEVKYTFKQVETLISRCPR